MGTDAVSTGCSTDSVWPSGQTPSQMVSHLLRRTRCDAQSPSQNGNQSGWLHLAQLAVLFAGLAREKDDDWIWGAMNDHPDLIGGFNRLDSTCLKAGEGKLLAKEGADGLLGLSIIHPDWPEGLGIVIKIAHGWNSQATWYVARAVLGVLGIRLRNPYPLHRQKAFIVPRIVPPKYLDDLENVVTWDEWDPNRDRFSIDWKEYSEAMTRSDPFSNEGMEGS